MVPDLSSSLSNVSSRLFLLDLVDLGQLLSMMAVLMDVCFYFFPLLLLSNNDGNQHYYQGKYTFTTTIFNRFSIAKNNTFQNNFIHTKIYISLIINIIGAILIYINALCSYQTICTVNTIFGNNGQVYLGCSFSNDLSCNVSSHDNKPRQLAMSWGSVPPDP